MDNTKPSIAVLLTCHNRVLSTLNCLKALYAQDNLDISYTINVFLVDDGSTDGTATEVANIYPNVHIIKGNGNLFWNRGMHLAWQTAAKYQNFDFYLWLNDDTELFNNAIVQLLYSYQSSGKKSIICGTTSSKKTGSFTYGGTTIKGKPILPNGHVQPCNIINGNAVLISNLVFKTVGNIDPVFIHAIGDFDYGLRAVKQGFGLYTTPCFIAHCEAHERLPTWCLPNTPFIKRIRSLYSPLGNSHPFYFFIYEFRHFGIFTALKHFFSIHLRVLIPSLWKQ